MRKNRLCRKIRIRRVCLIRCFAIVIIFFSVAATFLYWKFNPKNENILLNNFKSANLTQLLYKIDLRSDGFSYKLRKIAGESFDQYFIHCAGHDEYRPTTKKCIDSYGFSSSMLESLELLYILDLKKQYNLARNYVLNNFSCRNLKWVNRKEFWSRCIGSFIGSYLITTDKIFLSKAIECADSILFDSSFSPFIDIEKKETRSHSWEVGTSLADIVSGLPELFALSKLTKNEEYSLTYLSILNTIPAIDELPFFNFYDILTRKPSTTLRKFDGNTVRFFQILSIAQSIKPIKSIEEILRNMLTNATINIDAKTIQHLIPLFEIDSLLQKNKIDSIIESERISELLNYILMLYDPPYKIYEPESPASIIPFRFDASVLRSILRDSTDFYSATMKVLEVVNVSFSKCKTEGGFTGLMRGNSNEIVQTNVQHSSFFGQWLNLAALISSSQNNIVQNSVFNDRGHILFSNAIVNDDDDD